MKQRRYTSTGTTAAETLAAIKRVKGQMLGIEVEEADFPETMAARLEPYRHLLASLYEDLGKMRAEREAAR